jgi:hypothetical protein
MKSKRGATLFRYSIASPKVKASCRALSSRYLACICSLFNSATRGLPAGSAEAS